MSVSAPDPVRHLLIPFAGRSAPGCRAALAGLKLPNLERLLARLQPVHEDAQDDSTFSPPHERALAAAMGLSAPDGQIAWAAWQARRQGLPALAPGQGWALLTLCHWHVGIDDVALGDPAALVIDAQESQALLDVLRPFFADDGITLHPGARPGQWLAGAALFDGLATASIDRAVGQPISEWSPLTDAARPLRRLQNETQMLLYTHPLNEARTQRGLPPINSFWASGTGRLAADAGGSAPTVDDRLRGPALLDDAPGWSMAWQALDAEVIAPLVEGGGADLRLTLCGDRVARTYAPRPGGLGALARRLLFERAPALPDVMGTL